MNEIIVRCLVELIVALEFSTEDQMNPDFSIQLLESVSASFGEMSNEETELFMSSARKFADEYDNIEIQDFIRNKEKIMGYLE